MLSVNYLPSSIQDKICSYLYFSDTNSKNIEKINRTIKMYNENIINYLYVLFENRLDVLKYRILKYIVFKLDNKYSNCDIDYEISNDLTTIIPLITSLDIIQMNGLYKYIVNESHIL